MPVILLTSLPGPVSGHKGECHDWQVDKYYKVGEVWGPHNANCKQSRCTEEKGELYIDRVS